MVRIERPSADERLDALIHELAEKYGFHLDVQGWTRKTYDVYADTDRPRAGTHLVRVESFALQSGEIRVYDERGLPFAESLGEALENEFGVSEAVIIREAPPA